MSKASSAMSVSQDLHRTKFHCFNHSGEALMEALSNLTGKGSSFRRPESLSVTSEHAGNSSSPFQTFCTENQGVSLESSHSHSVMSVKPAAISLQKKLPRGPKMSWKLNQVSLNTVPECLALKQNGFPLAPHTQHTYGLSNELIRRMVKTYFGLLWLFLSFII